MRPEIKAIGLSVFLGLFILFIDSLFVNASFVGGINFGIQVSTARILYRILIFACFVCFGIRVAKSISWRRLDKELLIQSQDRFQHLVENLGSEYFFYMCNDDGTFSYLSPSIADMLGISEQDQPRRLEDFLLEPEAVERLQKLRSNSFKSSRRQRFDIKIKDFSGKTRHLHITETPMTSRTNRAKTVGGLVQDITARKIREGELHDKLIRDGLTGLYNKRHFDSALEATMKSAQRHSQDLSLCICDLDHFKNINDDYGHVTGDKALVMFSEILRAELRVSDIAARCGGDEFYIILPQSDAEEARRCVERVRVNLENSIINVEGKPPLCLTATFGITMMSAQTPDQQSFVEAADQALYRAKRSGRNRTEVIRRN